MLYRIIALTDTPETYAEPIRTAEDADGAHFIRNTVIYTDAAGERRSPRMLNPSRQSRLSLLSLIMLIRLRNPEFFS